MTKLGTFMKRMLRALSGYCDSDCRHCNRRTVLEHRGGYQPTASGPRPTQPPPKPSDARQARPPAFAMISDDALQAFYEDLLDETWITKWYEVNHELIVRAYMTGDWTLLDDAVSPER